jgi:hypothetical protein
MWGKLKYAVMLTFAVTAATSPTVATAAPVVLTTSINVWTGTSPNPGDQNDPTQQALPSNPLTSQTFVGNFSYTGPIDFANYSQATDLMSNWIPGIGLPALQMSTPTFAGASLFSFSFTLSSTLTDVMLTHDDGVSLFNITTNSANLIPGNEGPTSATTTAVPTLNAGEIYQLWYVASNGAPSILKMDSATAAVPEPDTWMLLIVGFGAVGMVSRRSRNTVRIAKQIA